VVLITIIAKNVGINILNSIKKYLLYLIIYFIIRIQTFYVLEYYQSSFYSVFTRNRVNLLTTCMCSFAYFPCFVGFYCPLFLTMSNALVYKPLNVLSFRWLGFSCFRPIITRDLCFYLSTKFRGQKTLVNIVTPHT